MISRLIRLTFGVALCAISVVAVAGPIYLAGLLIFSRSVSINLDGRLLSVLVALSMFGGAGVVAGVWTLRSAILHYTKSN